MAGLSGGRLFLAALPRSVRAGGESPMVQAESSGPNNAINGIFM
jgi:hypothetical protein